MLSLVLAGAARAQQDCYTCYNGRFIFIGPDNHWFSGTSSLMGGATKAARLKISQRSFFEEDAGGGDPDYAELSGKHRSEDPHGDYKKHDCSYYHPACSGGDLLALAPSILGAIKSSDLRSLREVTRRPELQGKLVVSRGSLVGKDCVGQVILMVPLAKKLAIALEHEQVTRNANQ